MFLLRQTERSVTEICLDVGFTCLGTFSRTFSEIIGEAPSAYRDRAELKSAPTCFTMSWMRSSSFEKRRRRTRTSGARMINNIRLSSVFVLDQDEALDFYVGKLGLEVHTDADLGFMRWLTVCMPGRPDREILLDGRIACLSRQ